MTIVLINGHPVALLTITAAASVEETLERLAAEIVDTAQTASFEHAAYMREQHPELDHCESIRSVIAGVQTSGLSKADVTGLYPRLFEETQPLLDWLRVIGDDFDITFRLFRENEKPRQRK